MKRNSSALKFWLGYFLTVIGLLVFVLVKSVKADPLDSTPGMQPVEHGEHHHHATVAEEAGVRRSVVQYDIPNISLIAMDGDPRSLPKALDAQSPTVLNFVFTTCTAICPMLTATFAQFQRELGTERRNVNMVSISIDPEHDTPAKLHEYAQKYQADTQWRFYTGELNDMVRIQKAFDVYRGNKMNHIPVTFLRQSSDAPWVRLDGFASAQDLMREYRQLLVQ